jgi:hypothetical protein
MPIVVARCGPSNEPIGPTALLLVIAVRIVSVDRFIAASRAGSIRTRIAGCSEPATVTSATPSTCDSRCAITLSAAS